MKLYRHILYVLIVLLCSSYTVPTPDKDSIEELKKTADKHFEKGEYDQALVPYQKLLGLEQSNYEYRYKYGACLLFATGDKQKALEFLEQSKGRNGVTSDIYYYLGKAYHLNYRFAEAIDAYKKYEQFAPQKDKDRFQIKRQIEMAQNGRNLLKNVTDIAVITKNRVNNSKFYEFYSLDNIGGSIINAKNVEEIKSKLDKKKDQDIIVHLPDKNLTDIVYYASYGESGSNGKDIYQIQRLPTGEWGIPQFVQGGINTKYDEDYPFMHPDGKYLYFCSQGHNSMGGYDIFRAKRNPDGTFGDPENMDFAINTPDDDLLYVVDSLNQLAYFASNRENSSDKFHVYQVRVARYPVLMAIIKGKFKNQIDPTKHNLSIEIKDELTGKVTNDLFTTDASGEYLITLPRSGKYTFIMKTDQSNKVHKATVNIPYQKSLKVMPQEILLFEHNGEQIEIVDKFSETHPDNDAILAELFNKKSKLDPNAEQLQDVSPIGTKTEEPEINLGTMTDQEIIAMSEQDQEDLREKLETIGEKKNAAFTVAGDYFKKAVEADEKAREATKLAAQASPEEKQQYEQMAKSLIEESKSYADNAKAAYGIAQRLEREEKDVAEDYTVAKTFTDGIRKAISGNNRQEVENQLKEQQVFIRRVMERNQASDNSETVAALEQKYEEAKSDRERSEKTVRALTDDESALRADLFDLEASLETAKKRDKEDIENRIASKKEELKLVQTDIAAAQEKVDEKRSIETKAQRELDMELGNFDASGIRPITKQEIESISEKLANNYLDEVIRKSENELELALNGSSSDNTNAQNATQASTSKYDDLADKESELGSITDDKQRMDKQVALDKEWIAEIDSDLKKLVGQYNTATDQGEKQQIQAEMDALKDKKRDKQRELSRHESQLLAMNASDNSSNQNGTNQNNNDQNNTGQNTTDQNNNPENTTPADPVTLDNTVPNYESDYLATNSLADPVQRAQKQNELNRNALSRLSEKEKSVRSEMSNGTLSEAGGNEQLAQIAGIRKDLEGKISNNEKLIEDNSSSVVNISSDVTYRDLDPAFMSEKARIEASTASEADKAREINELNTTMLAKIEAEIKATTDRLNDGRLPAEIANDRLGDLEEMRDALREEIATNNIALNDNTTGTGISGEVTADELVGNYSDQRKSLESNGSLSASEKAEQIIALNNDLISEIENEKRRTEQLRRDGTISNELADQRLGTLNALSEKAQNDNEAQTELASGGVPTITFGDLDSELLNSHTAVQKSDRTELEKARDLNALNEKMISRIDKEIETTETRRKIGELTDDQARAITEQLESMKREKSQEISANKDIIAKQGANYNNPGVTYSDPKALATYNATESSREKVSGYNQDIARLEAEKAGASERQQKKIQKKIDKTESKRDREEVRIGKLIGESNMAQFKSLDRQYDSLLTILEGMGRTDMSNADFKAATEHSDVADRSFETAQSQRMASENERDPAKQNDLIKQAVEKEQVAILQKNEANKLLVAMTGEFYVAGSQSEPQVTALASEDVPEDIDKRRSTEMLNKADDLESSATTNELLAARKRGEAESAKRSERQALLDDAARLELEAATMRKKADVIREQGDAYKAMEDKALAEKQNGSAPKKLSEQEEKRIRSLAAYVPYYDKMVDMVNARNQYKDNLSEKEKHTAHIRELKNELNRKKMLVIDAQSEEKTSLEGRIAEIESELDQEEMILKALQTETESIQGDVAKFRITVDDYLEITSPSNAQNFTDLTGTNGDYLPEPIVVVAADPLSNDFEVPADLNGTDIFRRSDKAIYDEENPIPVNEANPSGLVYKVQVGAFRNPIPQDLFADFAPISGEKLDNGITRYMVGYFAKFNRANDAKNQIRGFNGYEGAFVVAYIDGKRVGIPEALAYEGEAPDLASNPVNEGTSDQNTENTTPASVVTQPTGETITYTEDENLKRRFEEFGDAEEALQGKGIKGLYFTVQVGAFSRPIKKGALNIQPLVYFESNGLWRYTTGVFKSVEEANKRKDEVRNNGTVPDAFVTAFLDGQKITVARANELLAEQGEKVLTGSQEKPNQGIPATDLDKVAIDGLSYYVVLGKFRGQVSPEFTRIMFDNQELVSSTKEGDITEYRSIPVNYYISALDDKRHFEREGLSGLVVTAVYNGRPISLSDAEKLRKGETLATPRGVPQPSGGSEPTPVEGLEYKVILGVFDGNAPQHFGKIVFDNSDKGILSEQNEDFQTVYYIPNFTTFAQAQQTKDYFENEGIEDIVIKAFFNSEEISLKEAKTKTNEE